MQTSLRVSVQHRDQLAEVAAKDFNGASLDEVIGRLLDEHWERNAIRAVEQFADTDPKGWGEYLREAGRLDEASAAPFDPWVGELPMELRPPVQLPAPRSRRTAQA